MREAQKERRSPAPHRGSPRNNRWPVALVFLTVCVSYWHTGAEFGAVVDLRGWQSFSEMLGGLTSPDLSEAFLVRIARLAGESVLIGMLGTALAVALAIGLALAAARFPQLPHDPAARRRSSWIATIIRATARGVLACFRAIPEILWAFLFVRIFGLGPGPAVFAIAITFAGTIGKLFAELIEAVDPVPAERLRAAGASSFAVFVYGVLPLVRKQWVAYTLFRLECAIRGRRTWYGNRVEHSLLSIRQARNSATRRHCLCALTGSGEPFPSATSPHGIRRLLSRRLDRRPRIHQYSLV